MKWGISKKKRTLEIFEKIKEKGWRIDPELKYKNCRSFFEVYCEQDHSFYSNYQKLIVENLRCNECHKQGEKSKKWLESLCKEKGVKLLKIKGNKLKIKCKNRHKIWVSSTSLLYKNWDCKECKKENIRKDCINIIETHEGIYKEHIIKTIKNVLEKFEIICKKGHKFETNFSKLRRGHWCPVCAGKKIDSQKVVEIIRSKKGKIADNSNINTQHNFYVICKENHIFETNCSAVLSGNWCAKCCNIEKEKGVRKIIKEKKGTLLKNYEYKGCFDEFKVKCKEGHIFKTSWVVLSKDCWCPKCDALNKQQDPNFIKEYIHKLKGQLKKNWTYINNKTKFVVKCKEDHVFETNWSRIQRGHWCPYCLNKTEHKFRKVIEKYFKQSLTKQYPKWLKGLELDGYNKELKVAFEYQGEQHYDKNHYYHKISKYGKEESWKRLKASDFLKKSICKEKGILLIVIPYWIAPSKWKAIIKKKYKKWKG